MYTSTFQNATFACEAANNSLELYTHDYCYDP